MSEDIVPVVLYSLSAAGLLYVIRTRKHELIARNGSDDNDDASSPRVRGVSADHIVALEKSDKGALIDHPRRQALKTDFVGFSTMQRKLILVMVGLPARGKSYIVKMLIRYLTWTGIHAKVFNVGEFRRKLVSDWGGAVRGGKRAG